MSVLSTGIYRVNSEEEAAQMTGMAHGMNAAYAQQPGFERLIVARDVLDPMTIVTMSWWDSEESLTAWSRSQDYRAAKSDAGAGDVRAKMEFGRWASLK